MRCLPRNRLIFAIILFSIYHQYDCAFHKYHLRHSRIQRTEYDDAETADKLVRVKLSRSKELDTFEAISRSHSFLQKNSIKNRKPYSLNSHLIGSVGLGTPPQEFRFIFETTVSNMWISSLNCTNCGDKKRYNNSASSTYIEDGTFIQTGFDAGFRSIDKVSFGDIIIENQTFAEMTQIKDFAILEPFDGLFCLGFDNSAQEHVVTPLRQMVNQNLINSELFSIYQNSTGGEIILGGYDTNYYTGEIRWFPNQDLVYWAFNLDSIRLKESERIGFRGMKVCEKGCKVNIYTYLTYIIGPPEEVRTINEAIGAEMDEDDDTMFVLPDCDLSKLPNLVFTISYDDYEFTPEQYVQKVKKGDKIVCVSSLHAAIPYMLPGEWFIGSSVVGHIYTVFDADSRALGFAHAK